MMAAGCEGQRRMRGKEGGNGPGPVGYPSNGCFSGPPDRLWTSRRGNADRVGNGGGLRFPLRTIQSASSLLCNESKQIAVLDLLSHISWRWTSVCRLPRRWTPGGGQWALGSKSQEKLRRKKQLKRFWLRSRAGRMRVAVRWEPFQEINKK